MKSTFRIDVIKQYKIKKGHQKKATPTPLFSLLSLYSTKDPQDPGLQEYTFCIEYMTFFWADIYYTTYHSADIYIWDFRMLTSILLKVFLNCHHFLQLPNFTIIWPGVTKLGEACWASNIFAGSPYQ